MVEPVEQPSHFTNTEVVCYLSIVDPLPLSTIHFLVPLIHPQPRSIRCQRGEFITPVIVGIRCMTFHPVKPDMLFFGEFVKSQPEVFIFLAASEIRGDP